MLPGNRCDDYRLLEVLGRGGMAEVYLACLADADGPPALCALKALQRRWALDPEVRQMFGAECALTRQLHHENIVRVIDSGECLGIPYIVQEFVDGPSCARLLKDLMRGQRAAPEAAALTLGRDVLQALAHAHTAVGSDGVPLGIVHRDVSPGNILISRTGGIKLTDFGIAQWRHLDPARHAGQVTGKFGYMSPEQVSGRPLDARTDLFSLGVVLAEMLIGTRLFPGNGEQEMLGRMFHADLRELESRSSTLSPPVLQLLRRALQRSPDDRFPTAEAFGEALEEAAARAGLRLGEASLVPWLHRSGLMPAGSGVYTLRVVSHGGAR